MSVVNEKRMLDRETLRSVIQQWNTVRLDIFALSEPNENLEFHGVMRFYFQDEGQKVATKCIRVASDATVSDVIETLIEKFRPDMRMLSLPNYALYVVHANGEERKLNPDEKPLLVQLNWHNDDREGRFLLKNCAQKTKTLESITDQPSFKRKLSKREKKEQKKKEKLSKLHSSGGNDSENHVAEKLYTELPETSFTRSISNPEAVMRRRRQQKLEKKLQQFRSRDGGPDTGGTLKIYGESLCRDVPYKTLLLSIRDCAQAVVREMLAKYGMDKVDPLHYCLVQVNSDGSEYILDDDECPLSILMNHPTSRGSIMFHVRRRPADSQPRRRKKKPLGVSNGGGNLSSDREGPMLIEITHSGDGGRRVKLGSEPIEVGSANTNALQLFGPSIQARHCLISMHDGVCTVTPLHADGTTFVNGHHIQQPTILHNGSVVMFGRVASYRFVDSPSDGRYNLALSQSQLDSACLYESRSPTSPTSWNEEESRPISPVSSVQPAPIQKLANYLEATDGSKILDQQQITKPPSFDIQHSSTGSGNVTVGAASTHSHIHQTQNLLMTSLDSVDAASTAGGVAVNDDAKSNATAEFNETDVGNIETETKSISSLKSAGSTQDRTNTFPKQQPSHAAATMSSEPGGQEPILPAVLEFPEQHQDAFLQAVISELDVNSPNFKLAPVYTLYLCARYRASTHYRPDLQPTERAHKLTVFLHHVANLIQNVVQEQYTDAKILSFWMANSSEFLHFLKSDRHISAFSVQAQEVLAESVQTAFRNLVSIFHVELSQTLNQFLSENIDHDSAAGLVLSVLGSAMALLRRCRVNAALTIQLFSQLFHYINVVCFNKFVTTSHMCTSAWGKALSERLSLLELWAEKQGLELAADCHLAKINQCAQFLQAPKTSVTEVQQLACSCFRLNSLQMAALLSQETIPRNLIDTAVRMAESVADELSRADGREIRLEESPELPLALLLPDDGFSCDVVRGIPAGLVDFLSPFQMANMCRLASQPTSIGLWTVYMHQFNQGRSPSVMSSKLPQPEIHIIKLHKNASGMGLSIVAAKGAGQERLGIYIKSVVTGGAADLDGRLQAGDQLLEVDGQSLIGITQERAADHLVRTGPVVTLKVAKQGAIYHGLATLLQQPSPVIQRETENEFNCNVYDNEGNRRYHFGRSNESLNFHGSSRSLSRRGSYRRPLTSMMNHTNSTPYLSYNDTLRRMSNPDITQPRRYSLSLSNEDILSNDQLQQIHFDPRYRDCRSTVSLNSVYNRTRSSSLGSIGRMNAPTGSGNIPSVVCPDNGGGAKPVRYDAPPSIYVEDYDSRGSSHSSREMIRIDETGEPETPPSVDIPIFEVKVEAPSTDSNLSFVADVNLDDIPYIDDDEDEQRETRFYTNGDDDEEEPSRATFRAPTVSHSVTLGNICSIMINPGSRRGSNSSSRKTVSFDILANCTDESSTAAAAASNRFNNNSPHCFPARPVPNEVRDEYDTKWKRQWIDNGNVQGDREKLEKTVAAEAPNESLFKFCKIKTNSGSNNNNSNNDRSNAADVELNEGEDRADDIDGYVRQSHVNAIRDYVTRNYVCAPQENVAQSNNNNNAYVSPADNGSDDGDGDDSDHCKLMRNIRLLKESSFDGKEGSGRVADKPHFYRVDNENVNISNLKAKRTETRPTATSPIPTACTLIRKLIEEDFTRLTPNTPETVTASVQQQVDSDSMSYAVRWCVDPIQTNVNGKVKELTKFYDSLRDGCSSTSNLTKNKGLSSSTPNLSSRGKVGGKEAVDKLSSIEEEEVLNQLKQWSEFGSMGENIDKPCSLHRAVSCEDSISSLSNEDRGKCRYLDQVYDRLDGQRKSVSKSCVNLNEYHVVDYGWNGQPPDGFLLKKLKLCKKNCTKIENNRIKLKLLFTGSCPSLNTVQPITHQARPLSPYQPTLKQTLRQLKKQQNLIKVLKSINRKCSPPGAASCKHHTVPPDDIEMLPITIAS
ncbi:afadin isoform X7 [Toxorhynchites rutilus septentrionalis]|uniref:afadin isoform X7 n=1 Tax=Toxorhynchites rutilus septentrionalis TaxID=329112 RepID=UPI002478869F|nr:afadin isoform X7 [Toxorhynchites rutilus septentrionalis]